ncbi:outer membrane protein assembly factor BamE [Microbaculum marinum]|uniref:Outer membrane protein assembly factor BamE n=1 Tax=Microbaculum marinum TaxID=1764581 RepID=A0AAW9RWC7_9HYPH
MRHTLPIRPKTTKRFPAGSRGARSVAIALGLGVALAAAGCSSITQVQRHGYIVSQDQLDQVPVGSSKEQVDYVLGTPSTTATFGNEVYYYISQTTETTAFLAPKVTDQRILAIYFDDDRRVSRLADYGLQDGRVFDYISRTTPTTGAEVTLLRQIFSSAVGENV